MDPLTALSLAANVIAIVDVAAKLVHTTWQIGKSGAKAGNVELEDQTKIIRGMLARLKPGLNANTARLSQDDKDLVRLCQQSEDVSKQLLQLLSKCKAKEGASRMSFETLWRAVQSEWNDDAIQDLQKRLDSIDTKAHRLITVRYSESIWEQLARLDGQFKAMGSSREHELDGIRDAIAMLGDGNPVRRDDGRELMLKAAGKAKLGKEYAVQAGILAQLRFLQIDRRLNELNQRPAHEKSYLWLDGSAAGQKKLSQNPASFDTWLTSPDKLYWVSGVPGSGKSTLLKFLYSNQSTTAKLADWKNCNRILKAAYFFWEVGKIPLLKTQEGLLRTLVFQILQQCDELISEVYWDLWLLFTDATPDSQDSLSGFAGSQVSLDVSQLLARMQKACLAIAARGYGLFLVIDGLDEYEGKPSEIIKLLRTLTSLPSVKICASSRPDNAFLDEYGAMTTKLFMEQFNKPDIMAYVQDRLESHSNFKEDEDRETTGITLISTVVNNSSGVFLWVRLVMEDLEEGLTDRNTILQLQRRLDRLPKELERFFDHMLDRVDEDYHEDSVTMLLMTCHCHDLLPPLAYWFVSERSSELEALHEVKPTEFRRNNKRRTDIEFRLRSYCRGLLIVQDLPLTGVFAALPSSSLFGQKINFLHRTVREYLMHSDVVRRLEQWKPHNFNVDAVVCRAVRAQIGTSPIDATYFAEEGPIAGLLGVFIFHCDRLGEAEPQLAAELGRSLAGILSAQKRTNGHSLSLPKWNQATAGATSPPLQQSLTVAGSSIIRSSSQQSRREKLKEFFKGK